jgi:hypothetical protein
VEGYTFITSESVCTGCCQWLDNWPNENQVPDRVNGEQESKRVLQ